MQVQGKNYRTIWMDGQVVNIIDQRLIPHFFKIVKLISYKDTALAIKEMWIRGAGAIGAAGAYGLAQASLSAPIDSYREYIQTAYQILKDTRPTASNLSFSLDHIMNSIKHINSLNEIRECAVLEANRLADMSASDCKDIGILGAKLIKDNCKILTHCNAGWLAFVDWGSALSPIYMAKREGRQNIFVFVDETRPRCQGSRLTAWELTEEGINHAIIADNAAGYYMQQGMVDLVIVGADRIAANGDVANKIGTYEKAVLAKENNIPFYVAAPLSTIDPSCESGDKIPIEERTEDEVLCAWGLNDKGEWAKIRLASAKSRAKNPAFDITPFRYIKGIITPKGIYKPDKIMDVFIGRD